MPNRFAPLAPTVWCLVALSAQVGSAQAPAPSAEPPSKPSAPSTEPAASATPAQPESTEPDEATQLTYRSLIAQGVTEFDAARYGEARALFLRAHELWPNARTLRVLGMTSFELRHYVQAGTELQAALTDTRKPLSDEQRTEVASLLEQNRAYLGRFRVRFVPQNATLLVDGNWTQPDADGVIWLEVGAHELITRAHGYGELRRRLVVQGREDAELVMDLMPVRAQPQTPEPAPGPSRGSAPEAAHDEGMPIWPWTLGGAGLTGGAALVVFLVSDNLAECRDNPEEVELGRMGCTDEEESKIKTLDAVSVASAVVSGLLLGTTVALLIWDTPDDPKTADAQLAVGPAGFVLSAHF